MRVLPRTLVALVACVIASTALTIFAQTGASGHEEREVTAPDGTGSVPQYRTEGPTLLVCKQDKNDFDRRIAAFPNDLKSANLTLWTRCQRSGFRDLQAAVNRATEPGTIIKILPGEYREEPSLAEPADACANLPAPRTEAGWQILSYEQQTTCPHNQNLVAILGKRDLQIEGTGASPADVVIDAGYRRLYAVRADRSPGIYLRNFTVQRALLDAVSIVESDGFVVDRVVARDNRENGLFMLAVDHGLVTGCEAYGNGESGIAAVATADINTGAGYDVDRYAVEVRNCRSHDNLLGYSGTAASSVWVHDSVFDANSVGVVVDRIGEHPVQDHALFENNVIAANNADYYGFVRDGTCTKPHEQRGNAKTVVCPALGVPVGTGVLSIGGTDNTFRENWIYDNAYAGFVLTGAPGILRGDRRPSAQFDAAERNRYLDNALGVRQDGTRAPNGMDFWWDGHAIGSCWQRTSADGNEPSALPRCGADGTPAGFRTGRYLGEPGKLLKLYSCMSYDPASGQIPSDCDWFGATGLARIEVKWALAEALLVGLIVLVVWWRLLSGSALGFLGAALALTGLVVGVYGTLRETTPLTPAGLGLLGLGWVCCGAVLRRRARPVLGYVTMALGLFAVLGAIDRGLMTLPWIPVAPSVPRVIIELLWIPWAFGAATAGRIRTPASMRAGATPKHDPLEHFTDVLRDELPGRA